MSVNGADIWKTFDQTIMAMNRSDGCERSMSETKKLILENPVSINSRIIHCAGVVHVRASGPIYAVTCFFNVVKFLPDSFIHSLVFSLWAGLAGTRAQSGRPVWLWYTAY
jgi:hypothetical protein